MRKTRLFLFLAILLCSSKVFAYDFMVDNIAYNITSSTSPYTVAVTTGGTYTGDITIPATVDNTVGETTTTYNVTAIGQGAFQGCSGLTSITIPNSLTSIGARAFFYCSGLTSIALPEGVTVIGDHAFCGCTGLSSITIPDAVTSIEDYTFYSCSKLTGVTIPDAVTSIGTSAFAACSVLTGITIPDAVTSIGSSAFQSCYGLTSITIPNSVTSIESSAFKSCANLATVISLIENPSVVSLGSDVFTKSGKVATLYIPFGTSSTYGTDWTDQFTTTSEVPATITVSDALYATYCSTGNIDFTDSGLDAYIASIYDSETGKLTVTKCNKIPAGEGILVNGPAGTYTFTESCSSAPSVGNQFEGTNADMTLDQITGDYTNFILGTDGTNAGFYKVGESGTLAAHKAYLPIKTTNLPASSKKLVVEFKNEKGQTTDIKTVELNGDMENMIYNLQGQKVENPEHGIYIIKGKKTYIK